MRFSTASNLSRFGVSVCLVWSVGSVACQPTPLDPTPETEVAFRAYVSPGDRSSNPAVYSRIVLASDIGHRSLRKRVVTEGRGRAIVGIIEKDKAQHPDFVSPIGMAKALTAVRFRDGFRLVDPRDESGAIAADYSAPIEYMVSQAPPSWLIAPGMFRALTGNGEGNLFKLEPRRPGTIPLILIHGLNSENQTWMNFLNELQADPVVRRQYQVLAYRYPSGNHVLSTAADLREKIYRYVQEMDLQGKDPSLRQIVLVGHSMGGILSRLMVTDSGDDFWPLFSRRPREAVTWDRETLNEVDRLVRFQPVPCVKRVVFIASPQRGSQLAVTFPGRIANRLINVPNELADLTGHVARLDPAGVGDWLVGQNPFSPRPPTSIDNLRPDSPFVRILQNKAITVPHHTLIGNAKRGGTSDGVVPVESARLATAQSEILIPTTHNVHDNPLAPREVARILRQHLRR